MSTRPDALKKRMIRRHELRQIVPLADTTIYEMEQRGEFPRRFALTPRDIVVVPGWMPHTLHAADDLVLFSYSDRVAQEKLGFWREQRL